MSVLGNPVFFSGGEKNNLVGAVWATAASTSWTTANRLYVVDPDWFSYSAGTFTCKKAASFTVRVFCRGAYNSSGGSVTASYRILKNSSSVASASGKNNNGYVALHMVSLAVGDTLQFQVASSSSNVVSAEAMISLG